MRIVLVACLLAALAAQSHCITIDLSHKQTSSTFAFSPEPKYNRTIVFKGQWGVESVYMEVGLFRVAEHTGTHIDAPNHFIQGGMDLSEVTVDMSIATGVMIDCSREASLNRSYIMPLSKVMEWEELYGQIPMLAAVIVNFGWSHKYDDIEAYTGIGEGFIFPTVSAEAGLWLAEHRQMKILGVDTLSADSVNEADGELFLIHRDFLGRNRLLVENLKIPPTLPPRGFRFYAVPVKYNGATGAQVRAFAVISNEDAFTNKAPLARPGPALVMAVTAVVTVWRSSY